MCSEMIDLRKFHIKDKGWVTKYCLNKLADFVDISDIYNSLIINGGLGGDIDWGVHRWDEHTEEDFEVGFFEGYIYYLGEEEHGIEGRGDMEELSTEEELKEYLLMIAEFHKRIYPEKINMIDDVIEKLKK